MSSTTNIIENGAMNYGLSNGTSKATKNDYANGNGIVTFEKNVDDAKSIKKPSSSVSYILHGYLSIIFGGKLNIYRVLQIHVV